MAVSGGYPVSAQTLPGDTVDGHGLFGVLDVALGRGGVVLACNDACISTTHRSRVSSFFDITKTPKVFCLTFGVRVKVALVFSTYLAE